jgi:hypothetical protein
MLALGFQAPTAQGEDMVINQAIEEILGGTPSAFCPDPSPGPELTSLVEFGVSYFTSSNELTEEQKQRRLGEVRGWMRHVSTHGEINAAYLDTTTLHTARSLILGDEGHRPLTPATLIDLATFVNAVVLFDKVFYLENRHIDPYELNEHLGNEPILLRLPVSSLGPSGDDDELNGVEGFLRGYWYRTLDYVERLRHARYSDDPLFEDQQAIKEAWQRALGVGGREDLWFDPLGHFKSETFDTDGPQLLETLVSVYSDELKSAVLGHLQAIGAEDGYLRELHRVIDECNYRSLFNVMTSNWLQLPYLPNAFRLPFRHYLYRKANAVDHYLHLLPVIEKEIDAIAEPAPRSENLRLPLFLAAVLARISSLDQFLERLVELRESAAGFRRHRAELETALERRDLVAIKKLREALQADSTQLRLRFPWAPVASATAAVLSAWSGLLTPDMLAAVGILSAASQFRREDIEALKARVLKKQFWFLTDAKETAVQITAAYSTIERLWSAEIRSSRSLSRGSFATYYAGLQGLL